MMNQPHIRGIDDAVPCFIRSQTEICIAVQELKTGVKAIEPIKQITRNHEAGPTDGKHIAIPLVGANHRVDASLLADEQVGGSPIPADDGAAMLNHPIWIKQFRAGYTNAFQI